MSSVKLAAEIIYTKNKYTKEKYPSRKWHKINTIAVTFQVKSLDLVFLYLNCNLVRIFHFFSGDYFVEQVFPQIGSKNEIYILEG